MNDAPDDDSQPTRPLLREVTAPTELDDLRADMASMRRGYHGILEQQQKQTEAMGRLEVLATRIYSQLSTIKMTREIADVALAGAAVLAALSLAVLAAWRVGWLP